MIAMSAPVQGAGKPAIGVILITGPSARLTLKRMQGFGPALLQEAAGRIKLQLLLKLSYNFSCTNGTAFCRQYRRQIVLLR